MDEWDKAWDKAWLAVRGEWQVWGDMLPDGPSGAHDMDHAPDCLPDMADPADVVRCFARWLLRDGMAEYAVRAYADDDK